MTEQATFKPLVRLMLDNEASESRSGFGPGAAMLLERVVELGSLNAAAKSMGMAYTKAWKLMRACEESLGVPLLVRDGARGSSLTDDAVRILHAYRATYDELVAYAAQRFAAHIEE